MGAGKLDHVILEERKPDGRWIVLGVPIKPGALTVWPNEVGIVMRDGKVEDIFSEGKRKLPWRGKVRTYVVYTKPFDLTFWLKDPKDLKEPDEGVVLDQDLPVLTADGDVVTGRIGLTLSVVSSYEEHLLRLLRSGRSFVTERDVSDKIEPELLAKVLALDIYKYKAAELRGNREASGEIYESVSIEPAATIRRYGLRMDSFTVMWGLTLAEQEEIRRQRHDDQPIEEPKEKPPVLPPDTLPEPVPPPDDNDTVNGSYWLNMDSAGFMLHKGSCGHVKTWARPPKWKEFPDEKAAQESTTAAIRKCGDCFQSEWIDGVQKPPPPPPGSSYWVYEDRVTSQARVHEGRCRYCNHGEGMGHGRIPGDSEWHGPYGSLEEAFRRAEATGQRDVRGCRVCRPHSINGGWEEIGYSFKNGRKSMQNVPDWVRKQIPKYRRMFHTTDSHRKRKSYYLDGKTFTYRLSFSRVHRGADLRVCRTLREK